MFRLLIRTMMELIVSLILHDMIHIGFSRKNIFRKSPIIHFIKNKRNLKTYKKLLAMKKKHIVDSKINN